MGQEFFPVNYTTQWRLKTNIIEILKISINGGWSLGVLLAKAQGKEKWLP
jgi:hypothetical protein